MKLFFHPRKISISLKVPFIVLILICLSACNFKEREQAIENKTRELEQREQRVLLWEKNLQLKEDSLKRLLQPPDSLGVHTISLLPPALEGEWTAKMVCTETSCPGSAIGDTQTDTWQINAQDSSVIIKSVSRGQINRIYTGNYFADSTITASIQTGSPGDKTLQSRLIHLTDITPTRMKGTRVVIQPTGCKITYALEVDKKP